MNKLVLAVVLSLAILSLQGASNCNGGSSGNGLILDVQDDCVDADLCRFDCGEISGKKKVVLMKLDLKSSMFSDQVKDAYYRTCAWNLERKEILTDMTMEAAQGRGQTISQFIATFAREYRKKLPKAKIPVGDSPNTLMFKLVEAKGKFDKPSFSRSSFTHAIMVGKPQPPKAEAQRSTIQHAIAVQIPTPAPQGRPAQGGKPHEKGISNRRHAELVDAVNGGTANAGPNGKTGSGSEQKTGVAGSLRHFDEASSGNSNSNSDIWVPTVETMRDWVDYLIYVSNQYTFFKDLCKKHGDVQIAQMKLKENLQNDAVKGLYPKYHFKHVPTIKSFVNKALNAIIKKFGELYNNPQQTCPCMSIMKNFKDKKEYMKFMNILVTTCRPVTGRPILIKPIFKGKRVLEAFDEESDKIILESE